MVSKFCPHREPLRNVLMLLLSLAGLVSACGTSITSSSSPTPTSSQGIRGIFHEYALPPSQFVPFTITAGPDGNLWFTEIMTGQNGSVQAGKIGRITPTGTLSEFSLPSANTFGYRYHHRARWQPLVYRRGQDCAYDSHGEDQRVPLALSKYFPFQYHNRARWQPLVY